MSSPSDAVSCTWVADRMEAWIDHDLHTSEIEPLEHHLRTCEACARVERRARAVVENLRALPELEPPSRPLERAVVVTSRPNLRPVPRRPRSRRTWLLAAAAVLVAGLTAILATNVTRSPTPTDVERATMEVRYALGVVTRANRAAGRELGDTLNQGLPVERTASRIGRVLDHAREHRPVELDVHGG